MRKIRVIPRESDGNWNRGFEVQEKNGGDGKQFIGQIFQVILMNI